MASDQWTFTPDSAQPSQGSGMTFTPDKPDTPAPPSSGGGAQWSFTPDSGAPPPPKPKSNQATSPPSLPRIDTGDIPKPTEAAERAIEQYIKDPRRAELARLVVGQESSGGHSEPTPNKATAVGPYQITKATADTYHLDYSKLNDLPYATQAANRILTDLLNKTKGDPVEAAIGYNAGPAWIGTPYSSLPFDTQSYAVKVAKAIVQFNKTEPGGPTPEQKTAILQKNSPPPSTPVSVAAQARNPTHAVEAGFPLDPRGLLHGLGVASAKVGSEIDFARRHPPEAFMAIEGVLQRPAMSLIAGAINGGWKDPVKMARDAGMAMIHPQDHDKLLNAIETGILHDMGFKNLNTDQMHNLGKSVIDFALDIGLDPFSYVGVGEVLKLMGLTAKVGARMAYTAPIVKQTLDAAGHTKQGVAVRDMIDQHVENYHNLVKSVKGVTDRVFGKRLELDTRVTGSGEAKKTVDFFSKPGKMSRLATEQEAHEVINQAGVREEAGIMAKKENTTPLASETYRGALAAVKAGSTIWKQLPPDVARYTLTMFARHGDPLARKRALTELEKLGITIPPEELAKYKGGYITMPITNVARLHDAFTLSKQEVDKGEKWFPQGVLDANRFFKPDAANPTKLLDSTMDDYVRNLWTLMRYQARRQMIARQTAKLILEPEGKHGPVLGSMEGLEKLQTEDDWTGWLLNNARDHADPVRIYGAHKFPVTWNGKTYDYTADQWMNNLSQAFKGSILGNPVPHGIINLGMVVLAHANPLVAGRALKYMMPRALGGKGIPEALMDRLSMGARTSYWKEHLPSLATFGNLPFISTFAKKWYALSTDALDHMETAWRASYLQHLDKTMGTWEKDAPGWLMHELVKLQTVNEHLGDYSNPSKLAAILRAMGGLYTVFRFDVVRKATKAAVLGKVGLSLGAGTKAEQDLGKPYGGDVHINIVDDMQKILFAMPTMLNPSIPGIGGTGVDYGTSIASLGPIYGNITTGIRNRMNNIPPQTPIEAALGLAEYLFIGGASFQELASPTKAEQALPPWFRGAMHLLGSWFGKTNPRTERQRQRQFRKSGTKPLPFGIDQVPL